MTAVSLFPRRPPSVFRIRRWVTRDKSVVHVLLGAAACPEPVRRLLLRVDDNTRRRLLAVPEKSSPADRAALTRAFGPSYVDVLALREPRVRYVFDAALFPDSTVREALHVLSRVAFEGGGGGGGEGGNGVSLSDIYAWSKTSTSPSAQMRLARTAATSATNGVNGEKNDKEDDEDDEEKEEATTSAGQEEGAARVADATWTARLLDALFARAGGVTIKTTDLLRSIVGLRSGRVAAGGLEELLARHFSSSSSSPSYPSSGSAAARVSPPPAPAAKPSPSLTRMHAAKLVNNLGGIAHVTRSLSSSSPMLFGRADPLAMLTAAFESPAALRAVREPSFAATNPAAFGRFMTPAGEMLRTFVEERADGVMETEIHTMSREDFVFMARGAAAEAARRFPPHEVGALSGSGVNEHLVTEYFPSSVGAATMHTERDGGEEVRRAVAREHAAIARAEEQAERLLPVVGTHAQNTRYKTIHLSNGSGGGPSSSATTAIDLDAVFALLHTNMELQFITFFNGMHSVYKVNRMALHRHRINVSWVMRNMRGVNEARSRERAQLPFIAFVLDRNDNDSGGGGGGGGRRELLRIMLFEDRRLEMRRFVEGSDEDEVVMTTKTTAAGRGDGLTSALVDSVAAVNRLVLAPLNDKYIGESGSKMAAVAAKTFGDGSDGAVVGAKKGATTAGWVSGVLPFAPLDPYALVNGPYSNSRVSRVVTTTRVRVVPPYAPASIRDIARALNSEDLDPYVTAAVIQRGSGGSSTTAGRSHNAAVAMFKRCDHCTSSSSATGWPNWVAAWHGLLSARKDGLLPPRSSSSRDGGDDNDEQALIGRLAQMFATTHAEAEHRVSTMGDEIRRSRLLQKLLYTLETAPLQVQFVPRVAIIEREPGAYSIETHHVFDPLQIEVAIRVAHHALRVAVVLGAEGGSSKGSSTPSSKTTSSSSKSKRQAVSGTGGEGSGDMYSGNHEAEDLLERALRQQEQEQGQGQGQGQKRGTQQSDNVNNVPAGDDNNDDDRSNRFDTLEALKCADRHLFDSPVRSAKYASTCQKSRQPVVLSARELESIPDDRYDGPALAIGSTPAHARHNRYICPQVWCPQSRMPMTVQQYEAAGRRCPGTDRFGEKAILFDHPDWKDRAHYVGLLPPGKHPHGMCMPCCFRKPLKPEELERCPNMHVHVEHAEEDEEEAAKGGVGDGRANATESKKAAAAGKGGSGSGSEQLRYIKGNTPGSPLERGRFGLLPAAMMRMFNHSTRAKKPPLSSSRRDDNKHKRTSRTHRHMRDSSVCGNRPDGTGLITVDTNCFVRHGIPHHPQRFLQCMATVLDSPQGAGTPEALVSLIVDRLSIRDYLAVDEGRLCRMFMSDDMTLHHHHHHHRSLDPNSFARWFVGDTEYHATFPGLAGIARRVADALASQKQQQRQQRRPPPSHPHTTRGSSLGELLVQDPHVAREYAIYRSLQHFRAYMLDPYIIKTHGLLLDLFNMPLPWLNPRGVNIVVLEADLTPSGPSLSMLSMPLTVSPMMGGGGGVPETDGTADAAAVLYNNPGSSGMSMMYDGSTDPQLLQAAAAATAQCSVPRRLRLSAPLAFVCAQGQFYEPIVRVGLKQKTKNALAVERTFRYDRHPRARAVVDALLSTCRGDTQAAPPAPPVQGKNDDIPPTVSNIMRFLSTVFGRAGGGMRAQVIDYTFRLVGLVTNKDVFVPLYSSDKSPAMLVGAAAPPQVYYVRDVVRAVRPTHVRGHAVVDMFDRLAAAMNVPEYAVDRVLYDDEGGGGDQKKGEQKKGQPTKEERRGANNDGRRPLAIVLRGGALVPLSPLLADGGGRGGEKRGSAAGGDDTLLSRLVQEHEGVYLEELNIMVLRGRREEPRARYTRRLIEERRERQQEHREVAAKLQEDTRAFIEFHFLRSSFNPFPLEFRRYRMRIVLERALAAASSPVLSSPSLPSIVDDMLYGEDPLLQRSLLHDRYSKERHAALHNSPMSFDFVFDEIDEVRFGRAMVQKWLNEIVITPYAMPGSSSRVVDASAELRATARDSVLSGKCSSTAPHDDKDNNESGSINSSSGSMLFPQEKERKRSSASSSSLSSTAAQGSTENKALRMLLDVGSNDVSAIRSTTMSTNAGLSVPSTLSSTTYTTSTASTSARKQMMQKRVRRRHDRRTPEIVHDCDLWTTFALVARLTSFSPSSAQPPPAGELPRSAFRHVLRNTLHRDLRRYVSDPRRANDVAHALSSHPTLRTGFERVAEALDDTGTRAATMPPSLKKQQQRRHHAAAAAPSELFAELLALLDSPDYTPGLYDVRVLARFCRVSCAVIDADNMRRGVVWKEGGGGSPAVVDSVARFGDRDTTTASSSSSSMAAHENSNGAPLLVLIYTPSLATFDVVVFRSARTHEHALLLYPDDPGYERELMNIVVTPDDNNR